MYIHQLHYFIAVATHLNFTTAAKHLFVTQSAVSQQIADLEKQIGVKLFIRNKRSVRLTKAGAVFLKEATGIVNKLEEAILKTRKVETGVTGDLKVGFIRSPMEKYFPRLVKQFHRKYPDVKIRLTQYNMGSLKKALLNDELDIAFTMSMGLNNIDELEFRILFPEYHHVAMNCEHPLADRTTIDITELAQEPFVLMSKEESPDGYNVVLSSCANKGFIPEIVSEPLLMETVLLLIDSGIGISILPTHVKEIYSSPTIHFIDIVGNEAVCDMVASWKSTNPNPSISLFIKELDSVISQHPEILHSLNKK